MQRLDKPKLQLALLVLTLSACQVLQKDKLNVKQQAKEEGLEIAEQSHSLTHQNQLSVVDSSHHDYTLTLWPRGKFSFSITKGFQGEAEKVVLKGKDIHQQTIKLYTETKEDSVAYKASYSNKEASSNTIKQHKSSAGSHWGWVLVFALVIGLVWLYFKKKMVVLFHDVIMGRR